MRAYNHRLDTLTDEDRLTLVGQVLKVCTKCHHVLLSTEFYKSNKSTSRLIAQCKKCTNIRVLSYFSTDKGKEVLKKIGAKARQTVGYKESVKKHMESDKYKNTSAAYRSSDRYKLLMAEYNKSDRRKEQIKKRAYHTTEKFKIRSKEYRQSAKFQERLHSQEYKEKAKSYRNKRLQLPGERLREALHSNIWHALRDKKGGRNWEKMVGYGLKELMVHIEKQFVDGMSWDNYGQGIGKWHVDHIIPQSIFGYVNSNDLDFKCCWALSNLRPMWWDENISKGGKIIKPFQPSLDRVLYKGVIKNKVDMTIKDLSSVYKCGILS